MTPDTPPPRSPPHHVAEHIRASALTLAIGGGLMLYFGFSLAITWPANATPEAAEAWQNWNRALRWAVRGIGVMLVIAAGAAMSGRRVAALLATIADGAFAVIALTLAVSWSWQARSAGGSFDPTSILMLLLALLGVHGTLSSWRLYLAAGAAERGFPVGPADRPDESRHG